MDTQPNPPLSHPLRPYSVPHQPRDDFSWHSPSPSSTPPSLRYPPPPPPSTDRYSSTLDSLSESTTGLGGIPSGGMLLKAFLTSSLLSFTGVALVQPFEVGKTLCQVQWVPKRGVLELLDHDNDNVSLEEENDIIQDENEAETYFSDLGSTFQSQPGFAPPTTTSNSSYLAPPKPTDPSGYLPVSRPEWVMPIVVQGGVWEMIKSLTRWKSEGFKSLWKGQFTSFVYDTLSTSLQPSLLSLITLLFSPFLSSLSYSFTNLPLIYSPKPLPLLILTTLSHTITSLVLSPLDLVRTRLIVQSSQPRHEKYSSLNPFKTLSTISKEEGGLSQTYFHPNLLIPTLLEGLLKPLLHLSIPLIITRYFKIEPSSSPLSFSITELFLSSTSLLITIPLETVRKRLQLQSRASFVRRGRANGIGKPFRSSVELRPSPVQGIVECVWRILTEETGKLPSPRLKRRMSTMHRRQSNNTTSNAQAPPGFKRSNSGMSTTSQVIVEEDDNDEEIEGQEVGRDSSSAAGGLRQLYRGLSMGIGANGVVFLLSLVAGGSATGGSSGWAEM
ncbi:hypothetical protein JCM5350_007236 [Sporobolomyces pararoseus]